MRTPSSFAQGLLRDLLLTARVSPNELQFVLSDIGQQQLFYNLSLGGPPMGVWSDALSQIAAAGCLNQTFIDELAQLPMLVNRADDLDRVRVAMEILPSPTVVLPPAELQEAKRAARAGMLHDGVGFAVLGAEKPKEVGRHAGRTLNKVDQLAAWFDAANQQEVGDADVLWMDGLLVAAIANAKPPGKVQLQSVLDRLRARIFREVPTAEVAAGLEQIVQALGISLDAGEFVDNMAASLARICLVRIGGEDFGTGFLVGPDLVLTNHHVLRSVIGAGHAAADVSFTFDYRTTKGVVNEGQSAGLLIAGAGTANPRPWLVDASEATDEERVGADPDFTQPTATDRLDFALVRLASPIATQVAPSGAVRGHFVLTPAGVPFAFSQGLPLIIVGHPQKMGATPPKCSPQIFAIEPDSVIGVNPNNTRVRYRTNTLRGSSGSPVLSAQWELVALHHFGRKGQYNQGIPTAAIAARPAVAAAIA